MNKVLHC